MPGESPLNMTRQPGRRLRQRAVSEQRRRIRRHFWPASVAVAALALGWVWLWYRAAGIVDHTLAGWVEREAAAGRSYACGAQSIGGFPFRIEVRCSRAVARMSRERPPVSVKAKAVTITTRLYRPTQLIGDIAAPLTVAESGRPASLIVDWARARLTLHGLPRDAGGASVSLDRPRLDRIDPGAHGPGGAMIFVADHADVEGRLIDGSPRRKPVIEAVVHLAGARAPTLHPLAALPAEVDIDAVLHGFRDLAAKSWAERFREMQAAGGNVEIKHLRIAQAGAIVVGTGALNLDAQGRLDGLLRVAIVGIDNIMPRLGIDRLIGRGVDRLIGGGSGAGGAGGGGGGADSGGPPGQAFGTLDRLLPGLGGFVRESANASLIDNLRKMGRPTEVDGKPAILLPLRFADGAIYLGVLPLGEVPPLF